MAKKVSDFQFTNEFQVSLQWPLEVVMRFNVKFWPNLLKLNYEKPKKPNILQIYMKFRSDGRTHILTLVGKIEFYHI